MSIRRQSLLLGPILLVVVLVGHADPLNEAKTRKDEVAQAYAAGDARGAYRAAVQALAENESTLGPTHLEVARSLYQLAVMSQRRGRYEEAARQHARALQIRQGELAPSIAMPSSSVRPRSAR